MRAERKCIKEKKHAGNHPMVSALSQTTSPLLLPCGAKSRERLPGGLSPELVEEEGKTACAGSLPGSSPNMVQKRLAVVVVLLEPGLELGGGDHQQRVKGLSQRRLKQNRCCINGGHHSENGVRWQQVQLFVCNPRELKWQYHQVPHSPKLVLSAAGYLISPGKEKGDMDQTCPNSTPWWGPGLLTLQ